MGHLQHTRVWSFARDTPIVQPTEGRAKCLLLLWYPYGKTMSFECNVCENKQYPVSGRASSQCRRNSEAAKRECSWYWVEKNILILWLQSKKWTLKAWSPPTGYSRRPRLWLLYREYLTPEEMKKRPLNIKSVLQAEKVFLLYCSLEYLV